jgi:two-component system, cell cycle sensor histidine kinase and response regulator CckA
VKEGIVIQDTEGQIVGQNKANRDLLGFSDGDLLGETPAYYQEGGTEEFGRAMDDLLQWGSYCGEATCRVRSGRRIAARLSLAIIRDDADDIVGYATFIQDITEKKRVESALRESEERFAAFMRDTKGRYTYVNRAFEKYVGKCSSEIVGKTVFDIWPAEIAKALGDSDSRVLAAGRPMESYDRTALQGEEQTREWLAIKFPFRDRKGKTYVGCVSIDITERESLEEQLRQSQKMEAVGRLAGGIAHDFNNLLTIIVGYCELLLGSSLVDENQRGKVEEIKKAGERASVLTRQLLAFSRKQVLAPRGLDLNSVIESLRKMIERLIGEDIELVPVLHPHLNLVKADPGQVDQIVMNLVVNARDAMPSGGKLTIDTTNIEFDEAYVHSHPLSRPGHYVLMAVSDTGTGMDRETQKHIFEPFFTTKEKGKGTGLGLATVYGIVKQSGGLIWLYSEPGVGTTFKIYLPRVLEKRESPAARKHGPECLEGSETILVAEDESALRLLIRETLVRQGYKVLEAAEGKEALTLSRQYPEPIHLLVADVVMPQMSGCELAEQITTARSQLAVLYISGYTDNAIVHHGGLDSGTAFLQKLFSPNALAKKVRQVLSGHTALES